jgi:hypothetical protein
MNGQLLNIYAVRLFGPMNFNVVNQLIQHIRREFSGSGIFTHGGHKHIRAYRPSAFLVKLGPERFYPPCQSTLSKA